MRTPPGYQDALRGELHPRAPHGFCGELRETVVSLKAEAEAACAGREAWCLSFHSFSYFRYETPRCI